MIHNKKIIETADSQQDADLEIIILIVVNE